MGYLSAKDEGNQIFKHVPHSRDFTRSSAGTFPLKSAGTLEVILHLHDPRTCSSFKTIFHTYNAA